MIKRSLTPVILNQLFSGKTIILFGARQVGKTTLLKEVVKESSHVIWLNGDNREDAELLNNLNLTRAKQIFPAGSLVIIDEAQRLDNTGLTLKIIHDNCEGVQLMATGSSSFELTDKIKEAMTGRKWSYKLFPISFGEILENTNYPELLRTLETRMVFGSYPDVLNRAGNEKQVLSELASDYLYKDVFALNYLRNSDALEKLVQALAFQVGNQVSFRELSKLVQIDKETVEKYIHLLEEANIIFRLNSYSKNLRTELKRTRKIYFVDNGIRNAVINQFNPIGLRQDVGVLWENLMISERMKYNEYNRLHSNCYFWRTNRQQEVDYLEEYDGRLSAFELKWKSKPNAGFPKSFTNAYPQAKTKIIDKDNFIDFL